MSTLQERKKKEKKNLHQDSATPHVKTITVLARNQTLLWTKD